MRFLFRYFILILFISSTLSISVKNSFADNDVIPPIFPKIDGSSSSTESSYTSSVNSNRFRLMEVEVNMASRLASKEIDISSVFSGSLDFSSLDQKSSDINDFLDVSKNFYITPSDLSNSNLYNPPLTLSRCISLGMYYSCRVVVDTILLPKYLLDYIESGFKELPTSYVDLILSLAETSNLSEKGELRYFRNLEKKIFWNSVLQRGVFASDEPYVGMYKETKRFSLDLLRKYYSKIEENNGISNGKRKNVYVFIGNSPTVPIKTFLDALKEQVSNIKDDKLRDSLERSIFIDIPYSLSLLDKNLNLKEEDIFRYFSKHVDPSIFEGSNVIFVDLAWDGTTIGSFIRNFRRYLIRSEIHDYDIYADIHTFFPEGLRSRFLNQLSLLDNIDVQYSDRYFSFLMKNLFFIQYDNTLLSFVDPQSAITNSLTVSWNGVKYLPDVSYKWYRHNEERWYGNFTLGSRNPHDVSDKMRLPYGDYDEKNLEYLVGSLLNKYKTDWMLTIGTEQVAGIRDEWTSLQTYYSENIKYDTSLVKVSCKDFFSRIM